jgi:hypothetical protein
VQVLSAWGTPAPRFQNLENWGRITQLRTTTLQDETPVIQTESCRFAAVELVERLVLRNFHQRQGILRAPLSSQRIDDGVAVPMAVAASARFRAAGGGARWFGRHDH